MRFDIQIAFQLSTFSGNEGNLKNVSNGAFAAMIQYLVEYLNDSGVSIVKAKSDNLDSKVTYLPKRMEMLYGERGDTKVILAYNESEGLDSDNYLSDFLLAHFDTTYMKNVRDITEVKNVGDSLYYEYFYRYEGELETRHTDEETEKLFVQACDHYRQHVNSRYITFPDGKPMLTLFSVEVTAEQEFTFYFDAEKNLRRGARSHRVEISVKGTDKLVAFYKALEELKGRGYIRVKPNSFIYLQ